jgi:hypothetical protein
MREGGWQQLVPVRRTLMSCQRALLGMSGRVKAELLTERVIRVIT